jgi:hypothetical protein
MKSKIWILVGIENVWVFLKLSVHGIEGTLLASGASAAVVLRGFFMKISSPALAASEVSKDYGETWDVRHLLPFR